MKSLVNNDHVLFDETCYEDKPRDAGEANSHLRYFSEHASRFRTQLSTLDWSPEDIDELMNLLWTRVITNARAFRIPLTPGAEVVAKRLKLKL